MPFLKGFHFVLLLSFVSSLHFSLIVEGLAHALPDSLRVIMLEFLFRLKDFHLILSGLFDMGLGLVGLIHGGSVVVPGLHYSVDVAIFGCVS